MSERKVTFCRICEASCGLIAEVDEGRVVGLTPDPDHVVTKGYACVKGTRYDAVHNSPDRLKYPLKRVGDKFERISWEQALSEIGARARSIRERHGRHGLGLYMGNPSAFSAQHPIFAAAFMSALGSKHLYTAGSQDCANKFAAAWEMFGSPMIHPVPDFDNVRCFIIIGSNPAISQMRFINAPRPIERLKAIEKRGGRVYFVNPRRTESAAQVGEQVFIRPDTDVFFLLSFVHALLARHGVDGSAAKYIDHLEGLERAVSDWPAERTAKVTGISVETLHGMVDAFATSGAGALYASTGLNQGRHGTLAAWLLNAANVVSGNFDRRGGTLLARSTLNLALLGKVTGAGYKRHRSRIADLPSMVDALPAAILPDEILMKGDGQIRGLFVSAGNPVLSCPNGERLERALQDLELLVSIDMFRNETAKYAHYVLPASSFLERSDLPLGVQGFQPTPYVQLTEAVVPPDGEQKDEWWIFTRICDAMGLSMFKKRALHEYLARSAKGEFRGALSRLAFSSEKLYELMVRISGDASLDEVKAAPHGLLLSENPVGTALGKMTKILRPRGKVDVAPHRFVSEMRVLDRELEEELRERKRLKLISKRERTSHNSWMHNVDAFVRPPRNTNYLYMHPDDARERGIADGALVEVRTSAGSVRVPVKHSDDLMAGAVALPHGWGHAQADGLSIARTTTGVNANALAADGPHAVERLSGMAHLTGLVVDVELVSAAE